MTGRPSSYTQAIADEICEWLCEGNSLRTYCQQEGKPSYGTVFRWLESVEGFREHYAHARETQAHNDADRMEEIVAKIEAGSLAPDQGRVMADALKWCAGKRLPKVYGDRLAVGGDHDGAPIIVSWAGSDKL